MVSEDGLTITGKVAGLGKFYANESITISYGSEISVIKTCTNSQGHLVGNNNGTFSLTDGTTIKVDGKKGHVSFTLNLNAENTPVAIEDCKGDVDNDKGVGITTNIEVTTISAKTLSFSVGTASGSMTL